MAQMYQYTKGSYSYSRYCNCYGSSGGIRKWPHKEITLLICGLHT